MSKKQKNPVGRPRLDDLANAKPEGFTCTNDLKVLIRATVTRLNRKGYKTNKSEMLRILIEESLDEVESIYKRLKENKKKTA